MLLCFRVENHCSIRDAQELLLSVSQQIRLEGRRRTVFSVPGIQVAALPAVALYGSHVSGKSNLIAALNLMRNLIVSSHAEMRPVSPIRQQPFLPDHDSPAKSTRLECTFTLNYAKELSSNGQTKASSLSTFMDLNIRKKKSMKSGSIKNRSKKGEAIDCFSDALLLTRKLS